jgi:hypothetical protein
VTVENAVYIPVAPEAVRGGIYTGLSVGQTMTPTTSGPRDPQNAWRATYADRHAEARMRAAARRRENTSAPSLRDWSGVVWSPVVE